MFWVRARMHTARIISSLSIGFLLTSLQAQDQIPFNGKSTALKRNGFT